MPTLSEFRDFTRTYRAAQQATPHPTRKMELQRQFLELFRRTHREAARNHHGVRRFFAKIVHLAEIPVCDITTDPVPPAYAVRLSAPDRWVSPLTVPEQVTPCFMCGHLYLRRTLTDVGHGHLVCERDRRANYRHSRRANAWIPLTAWDPAVHADAPAPDSTGGRLSNYSEDPIRSLRSFKQHEKEKTPNGKRPRYLGVELEVVPRKVAQETAVAETRKAVKEFAILKRDGSIDACQGFEIVSIPATMTWHRGAYDPATKTWGQSPWDAFFRDAAPKLQGFNVTACSVGMHIHVDRESLGKLVSGKVMAFVHSSANREFIARIAGRKGNQYSIFYDKTKVTQAVTPGDARSWNIGRGHYDTCGPTHHGTIEFRMFRSNVARRGFFKNLEFVDALCAFAEISSVSELKHDRFLEWFVQPEVRSNYPNLEAWFIHHKVVTVQKRVTEEVEEA